MSVKGLPVAGYRDQTQTNVDLVNSHKVQEEMLLRHLDRLAERGDIDARWLAIGRSHIEQGFMAINRAVFQPERLTFNEEKA